MPSVNALTLMCSAPCRQRMGRHPDRATVPHRLKIAAPNQLVDMATRESQYGGDLAHRHECGHGRFRCRDNSRGWCKQPLPECGTDLLKPSQHARNFIRHKRVNSCEMLEKTLVDCHDVRVRAGGDACGVTGGRNHRPTLSRAVFRCFTVASRI